MEGGHDSSVAVSHVRDTGFINGEACCDFNDGRHAENSIKEYADKPLLSKPYEEYLNENILKPAGMTHTALDHASAVVPERASGYRWDGETIINATYGDPAFPVSAGALRSTLDDMYRFDRAMAPGLEISSTEERGRIAVADCAPSF